MLKLKVCEKSDPESRLPFLTSLPFNLPPVVIEQRLNGASVFSRLVHTVKYKQLIRVTRTAFAWVFGKLGLLIPTL